MIKPILSSVLVATFLFASTGQAMASDRHQSYRDQGANFHQNDRDRRGDFRREFHGRRDHDRLAYRFREYQPRWRHRYYERRWERRWERHEHRYLRPVVVVRERNAMAPFVAGAILGTIIANQPVR